MCPIQAARAHGAWSDINQVYAGTKILVVLTDGKSLKGFSNSATESALVIVDANGRERIDIPRDRVVAFYGLLGGYGGVKKGASKGAEGLSTGSRDKLPGLVFAGVGALVGLVQKRRTSRVDLFEMKLAFKLSSKRPRAGPNQTHSRVKKNSFDLPEQSML
jgi:hypothetical protein